MDAFYSFYYLVLTCLRFFFLLRLGSCTFGALPIDGLHLFNSFCAIDGARARREGNEGNPIPKILSQHQRKQNS